MSDFSEVSPADLALVRSCSPDERCMYFGNELVKLPIARMTAMLESAFKDAWRAAEVDGAGRLGEVTDFEIGEIERGDCFMRVTQRDAGGREATGVGMFHDPGNH